MLLCRTALSDNVGLFIISMNLLELQQNELHAHYLVFKWHASDTIYGIDAPVSS